MLNNRRTAEPFGLANERTAAALARGQIDADFRRGLTIQPFGTELLKLGSLWPKSWAPDVTVQITPAEPVACPGHPLELKAIGSPAGGDYLWTVIGAEMVDSNGSPTMTGDRIFIRSLKLDDANGNVPAQSASVTVTYTFARLHFVRGTATDTKTVPVHKIDFVVTNTTIKADKMYSNEISEGMYQGVVLRNNIESLVAAISTDPTVQITIDPSCPRKDDCAKNHRVGWLQTMLTNERVSRYNDSEHKAVTPTPIRDAVPPDALPPFYENLWIKPFARDGDTQTAHHEDSPVWYDPWKDSRKGAPPSSRLLSMKFSNSFTAWLVVQNVEWSAHDALGCYIFLHNFAWSISLNVNIDWSKVPGIRCTPASSPVRIDRAVQKGKGASSPVVSRPTFTAGTTNSLAKVDHLDG